MQKVVSPETAAASETFEKIKNALEDPRYVWRTPRGLSRDTALPEDTVLATLNKLPDNLVVTANGKDGKLYTTRKHYYENQSFLGRVLTAATGRFK